MRRRSIGEQEVLAFSDWQIELLANVLRLHAQGNIISRVRGWTEFCQGLAGMLCRSGFSYLFVGLEVGKEVGAGVAEGLKVVYVVVVVV